MNHRGRWRMGALASAAALLSGLTGFEAQAVALGRITVQSALGESLRAEIDISDLSPEEASSLRIGVAGAEAFKSAGLEYSAAAAGLDVKLQKRANGRSYLRLSSNRAVTDPFVDLVLEAQWASGRMTRDYTMLFDPPNLRANSASSLASAPLLPREPGANAALSLRPGASAAPSRAPARAAESQPGPAANGVLPAEIISGARQVTVKPGDNANKIAAQNKPVSVSLEQMLMALLKSNPDAFVNGNINLIKPGAVLEIPDERAANALSSSEAKRALVAQSQDFNTFRRKLAGGLPAAALPDSRDRQASGSLQARDGDRAPAVIPPGKRPLSNGAVQGVESGEPSAKGNAGRPADPSKNSMGVTPPAAMPETLAGVRPLGPAAANPMPGGGTGAITAAPGVAVPLPNVPDTGAAPASAATSVEPVPAGPASQPAPVASAPAVSQASAASPQPGRVAPLAAPPAASLVGWMFDNSLLLGGGALLALLAALGIIRYRKGQKSSQMDSSLLDSRLQPDSFFGAGAGQRAGTGVSHAGQSSIAYSPSQLDAAGDVDPLAEADVYLAYGRDQQAEDILREALHTYPARIAIHAKLLEILAKRRDNKAFEGVALSAFKLSGGQGTEWLHISQLGHQLEPGNALYRSGTAPANAQMATNTVGSIPPGMALAQGLSTGAPTLKTAPALDLDLDLDLDLGFVLDGAPVAPASSATPVLSGALVPTRPGPIPGARADNVTPSAFMELDLNLDDGPVTAPGRLGSWLGEAPSPVNFPASSPAREIDFLAEGLDFTPEPYTTRNAPVAPPLPVNPDGMLEFDLDLLSLDLGPGSRPSAAALAGPEDDPLEVKLLLAEEFRVLGDSGGARSLASEVVAKAKGPLKLKAQVFLNSLS